MNVQDNIMASVVELCRGLTQTKRVEALPLVQSIAEQLGLEPAAYDFIKLNVSKWPANANRNSTELRYLVDFDHGDQPDPAAYVATFDEVCKLLRYTPGSCKVAFSSTPTRQVNRVQRPTRLGPCIITRLDEPVPAADNIHRLSERDALVNPPPRVVGGRQVRFRGNKY